jgi:carbon monoxide dehydrogenase subunit G
MEPAMEFRVTTEIDASPDIVFAVLIDVERWPEMTSTVTTVERLDGGGELAVESRLRIIQPRVPPSEYTVTALESGRGFAMTTHSPGAHVTAGHWIEPLDDGRRSRVTLSVTFTGWLGSLIGRIMRNTNERYLAEEAAGLKRRCEEMARVGTDVPQINGVH